MIPLAVPDLSGNEARYLQECIASTFVSSVGPFVDRFETMVAQAAGAAGSVACASGTSALHAALLAVGVGRDDLVILPSFTFIASANAIAHCGATPWLFDVDPASWTLDPPLVAAQLDAQCRRDGGQVIHRPSGRRVAAMVPVHVLGMPADMDPLVEIARGWGLKVVADGAAALGATYKDRPIGRLGADLTMVSFNGNKTVTAGGGGAAIGDDPDLLKLVRHLTTTARRGADYDHDRVGYNYRMTNLQAAVGCAQMERLDQLVAAKRRIAAAYDRALTDIAGTGRFPVAAHGESACWFSGITVAPPLPPVAALRPRLRGMGIDARPFWKPMHMQAPYADAPRTAQTVAEAVWPRVLTLPCSTHLGEIEQAQVIAAVRSVLGAG